MKRFVNVDIPRFHANPKGDDYGCKRMDKDNINSNIESSNNILSTTRNCGPKDKTIEDWMGPTVVHNATLGGFNLQLVISPSGRDWHLRVAVPEHFQHQGLDVCDHISLSNSSVRDI